MSESRSVMATSMSNRHQNPVQREKRRIWKNVVFLSISFMCLFTAFGLVSNLQSTINSEAGLGNTSQAVMYVVQILSSLFAPSLMMDKLKVKWTMALSQIGSSFYIASQFYPSFSVFIPSAIIVGFSAAPMWSAQSTYLTQMGLALATLTGRDQDSTESSLSNVFGIAFMITQSSTVWGNLIGSLVLARNGENTTKEKDESCGAAFCYHDQSARNVTADQSPPNTQMLMGILLAISLFGTIILIVLVDPPDEQQDASYKKTDKSVKEMLMATFRQMMNPTQLLLIPLSLWAGCEKAFWTADFTYAFITCSWGVENIGYVLICFGLAAVLSSWLFSNLVGKIGRSPFFVLAAIIHITLLSVVQFFWLPDPERPEYFLIIATLWGLAHSIVNTALNTLYGVLFVDNKEAAFSNFRLWKAVGLAVALVYSNLLCIRIKLYILKAVLLSSMIGYLIIEIRERRVVSETNLVPRVSIHSRDDQWTYVEVASKEDSSKT